MQSACFMTRAANTYVTLNRSIFESNSKRCLFNMTCMIHRIINHFLNHIIKYLFLGCRFIVCASDIFPSHSHYFLPLLWVSFSVFHLYPLGQCFPFKRMGSSCSSFPCTILLINSPLLRNCQGDRWVVQTRGFETTAQQTKREKSSTGGRSKWDSHPELGM